MILLLDSSDSIGPEGFLILKEYLKTVTAHFDIDNDSTRVRNGYLIKLVQSYKHANFGYKFQF